MQFNTVPFASQVVASSGRELLALDRARAQKILSGQHPHGPAAFELRARHRHRHGHGGGSAPGDGSAPGSGTDVPPSGSTGVDVTDAGVTYTAAVDVGNPPTTYTLLIDTGKSLLRLTRKSAHRQCFLFVHRQLQHLGWSGQEIYQDFH